MAGAAVDDCLHTLNIGLPRTIGTPMRVRDLNTKGNALIAKFALSHSLHLLAVAYFLCPFCRHNWYDNRNISKKQVKFSKKMNFFQIFGQVESIAVFVMVIYNIVSK